MGRYDEMLEELSQGPRFPRSRGPKVPGSQGPKYLKLKFKYELDSKEGPSCFLLSLLVRMKIYLLNRSILLVQN